MMRIYRFDAGVGMPIIQFNSQNVVVARGVRTINFTQSGVMHLGAGGVLGYHQAALPQLFMVIQGEGWVRGETNACVPIKPGQAAFWTKGEWHESGTAAGMSAIVVESDSLDPTVFMQEVVD